MFRKSVKPLVKVTGIILVGIFIMLSWRYFHAENFLNSSKKFFLDHPLIIILVSVSYLSSFMLRAEAWRLYLGKKAKFISCLQGILLSLFVNHITPIKVGDAVRVGVLSWKEKDITPDISAHSVVVLRSLDMLFLMLFSMIGLVAFSKVFIFHLSLAVVLILGLSSLIGGFIFFKYCPHFVEKHILILRTNFKGWNFVYIFFLIGLSWAMEGAVLWGVTASLGDGLSIYKAIWANSITVGGQVFQITPGGISTYESVMTAALTSFGFPIKDGYMVALISHSYKFIFSYFVGILLLILSPALNIRQIHLFLRMRGRQK
ncbi:lysylphosphatidylglycerol synthase transmembrane domain-containing protein [Neobacillus sp. OS1-33]|uniref:lysylphosphatidylglycerol synthase transmembrane domain-containing protein n=1 Tax=Neobacillus sp. OS1-33 TaxID=3070683 RepID=UPI0027DFE4D7|nr:lysylphosphatidylglycerol synthase transmembrane domain-containing protein [Neobacillus sp. OS1-33]WML27928.1 lysylphosphatidylglycerol synthase transmembrane domain-containing protein [Neobacillus sp. OS1-33]